MPETTSGEPYAQLPPAEAVRFFQDKLALPTRAWTDVLRSEHDRAFVTAGATKMDFLQDLKGEVQKAIEEGTTIKDFREGFDEAVGKHGWPYDAEDSEAYRNWRTRVIYETNLSSAYAAGRYEKMTDPDVLERRPYWLYRHGGSQNPRERHLSWDGLVLPADDPWWDAHYPPSAWGCSCTAFSLSKADVERRGLEVAEEAPEVQTREWTNPNTGEVEEIPEGIDPGWGYTPGKSRLRARSPEFVDNWPDEAPNVPEGRVLSSPEARDFPAPRTLSEEVLLPDDLTGEEYARAFLQEFGADIDEPEIVEDVTGEPLVVSDELFKNRGGEWKIKKQGRAPYMRLLAQTLQSPDEVWARLEPVGTKANRYTLRRRYLARWDVEGQATQALAVFEWSRSAWNGITTFPPRPEDYLERQRAGVRLYARAEEEADESSDSE